MTVTNSSAKEKVLPEELMAIILLSTTGSVSDLSQRLMLLKENGIDIGFMALRRAPGGVYSEDIDQYVSYLLTFDYVRERSPKITITEKGRKLCEEVVKNAAERNPQSYGRIAKILDFDLKELIHQS